VTTTNDLRGAEEQDVANAPPTEPPASARPPTSQDPWNPAESAPPPPAPPRSAEPPRTLETGSHPRRRGFLAGALAGALTGALVAGAIAWAADDGNGTSAPDHSSATIDGLDVAAVLKQVEPSVVAVQTEIVSTSPLSPGLQEAAGTGFIVSSDGKIVTNNHVIEGAEQVQVTLDDGSTKSATVVGADESADVAVLKIDASNLPTVKLGDSNDVAVGDPVVAIGNALDLQGTPTVTEGIVSALNRSITEENGVNLQDVIQTDAAINPGNSGGPLVDSQGRVIGIDTAGANEAQNIGFAISIDQAKQLVDQVNNG
jgi:S1-C subfamily serine protease